MGFQQYCSVVAFCSLFVVLHPCTLLNIVLKNKNTSSMCWDFDVLVFLHVVCVDVVVCLDGLGLKKEFVIFRLSDGIRLSNDVTFLFLFSIPKGPIVSLKFFPLFAFVPTFALMSCPNMMFDFGGRWFSSKLRVELKFLYSLLSTG